MKIELTMEELKEWINLLAVNPSIVTPNHSSISSTIPCPAVTVAPPSSIIMNGGRFRKTSLDTIKKVKELAESGKSTTEIADALGMSRGLVDYWRKNTPREMV